MWKQIETDLYASGKSVLIGIDEAGCGCLAGPLVVAACYIPQSTTISGIKDSKKLKAAQRESIYNKLTNDANVCYKIVFIDPKRIDEINILQSRLEGFALSSLRLLTDLENKNKIRKWSDLHILIDGNVIPTIYKEKKLPCSGIVKGDHHCICIGAASILAKVTRDRYMTQLSYKFPNYGFHLHFGYPTEEHRKKISEFGILQEHYRHSFRLL
jgi:ribonuclease HII